jgi:hypothetical protein
MDPGFDKLIEDLENAALLDGEEALDAKLDAICGVTPAHLNYFVFRCPNCYRLAVNINKDDGIYFAIFKPERVMFAKRKEGSVGFDELVNLDPSSQWWTSPPADAE